MLEQYESSLIGEKREVYGEMRVPRILSIVATLTRLCDDDRLSFARIGDGELTLMGGNAGCVYEKGCEGFAEIVSRMLSEERRHCMVGLSLPHFYNAPTVIKEVLDWLPMYSERVLKEKHLDNARLEAYGDATLTVARHHYDMPNGFWFAYYWHIVQLFNGKDVILVTGDDMLSCGENMQFLRHARSVDVLRVPSRDALQCRDDIRRELRIANGGGNKVVCLCCGPLASVMAWELSNEMRCLDMGHFPREFAEFEQGIEPTKNFNLFFCS